MKVKVAFFTSFVFSYIILHNIVKYNYYFKPNYVHVLTCSGCLKAKFHPDLTTTSKIIDFQTPSLHPYIRPQTTVIIPIYIVYFI